MSALQDEDSPARARAMEEQARRAARLVDFVEGLAGRLPPEDSSSWRQFGEWAKDALDYYAASPVDWPEPQQSALDRVEEVLGQLSELDDVEPGTTLTEFRQALEQALDTPSGRTGATGSGVFVASLGSRHRNGVRRRLDFGDGRRGLSAKAYRGPPASRRRPTKPG